MASIVRLEPTIVLGLGAALALACWAILSGPDREAPAPPSGQRSTAGRAVPAPALAAASAPETGSEREALELAAGPSAPLRLRCLDAAERSPLAGVRLYLRGGAVAGPSGSDGWIGVECVEAAPGIVWAEGWAPALVPAGASGERAVLLERAAGGVVLQIAGLAPGEGVVRSELQPLRPELSRAGPWKPALREAGFDRLEAGGLAAGGYEAHVWVGGAGAAPRVLSSGRFELGPRERKVLWLDAAAPPAAEPDG